MELDILDIYGELREAIRPFFASSPTTTLAIGSRRVLGEGVPVETILPLFPNGGQPLRRNAILAVWSGVFISWRGNLGELQQGLELIQLLLGDGDAEGSGSDGGCRGELAEGRHNAAILSRGWRKKER